MMNLDNFERTLAELVSINSTLLMQVKMMKRSLRRQPYIERHYYHHTECREFSTPTPFVIDLTNEKTPRHRTFIDREAYPRRFLPDKLVLVATTMNGSQLRIIFNKNDGQFYGMAGKKVCYPKLQDANRVYCNTLLGNIKLGNAWSSFRAENQRTKKTTSIEHLHVHNWLEGNSASYCLDTWEF